MLPNKKDVSLQNQSNTPKPVYQLTNLMEEVASPEIQAVKSANNGFASKGSLEQGWPYVIC